MEPPVDFSTQTRDARNAGAAGALDGSSELMRTRDELAGAFRTLVATGEELMRQTSSLPGDAVAQARERFREALTAAQSRIGEFSAQARERGAPPLSPPTGTFMTSRGPRSAWRPGSVSPRARCSSGAREP